MCCQQGSRLWGGKGGRERGEGRGWGTDGLGEAVSGLLLALEVGLGALELEIPGTGALVGGGRRLGVRMEEVRVVVGKPVKVVRSEGHERR